MEIVTFRENSSKLSKLVRNQVSLVNLHQHILIKKEEANGMPQKLIQIYTHPTCEDSQALKQFLSEGEVPYNEVDVTESLERRNQLKQETGNEITPGIVVETKNLFGKKKRNTFSGYGVNKGNINRLLH